jgi:hypothetical protein
MKRQRKTRRGHARRVEKRLAAGAKGRAVVVNGEAFAAWLVSL